METTAHEFSSSCRKACRLLIVGWATTLASANFAFATEGEPLSDNQQESTYWDPIVRDIEGWTVHIDPKLVEGEHAEQGERAVDMLGNHLQRIAILVPEPALTKLKTIEIWIEHRHELSAMQYHPGRRWLTSRGYDPRLTQKVHITRAAQLLSREQMLKHPAVILHELAHGFHDQILSFDHQEIIDAYDAAAEAGSYEEVLLYTGDIVRHYGLSNHKEYFAEGTEAFFYRNDFFPFVRAELKRHDPEFEALLERVWLSDQ